MQTVEGGRRSKVKLRPQDGRRMAVSSSLALCLSIQIQKRMTGTGPETEETD